MNAAAEPLLRVLVADDHAPTRDNIRHTLEHDGRFEVCAEVANAAGAIQAALREKPDICLLDVRMPGGGIAAVWEIGARLRETKIVMLTVSGDDADLFTALQAGIDGYLRARARARHQPGHLGAMVPASR